jgi:hypothetical protein
LPEQVGRYPETHQAEPAQNVNGAACRENEDPAGERDQRGQWKQRHAKRALDIWPAPANNHDRNALRGKLRDDLDD